MSSDGNWTPLLKIYSIVIYKYRYYSIQSSGDIQIVKGQAEYFKTVTLQILHDLLDMPGLWDQCTLKSAS